jgi:acetyl/propionyl-CoA carboxylase alpha subunit
MIHTGFIEQYGDAIIQDCIDSELARKSQHPMARLAGAMAILLQMEQRIQNKTEEVNTISGRTKKTNVGPWSSHSGSWRMGGETARVQRKLYIMPEKHMMICTSNRDGSFDMAWHNDNDDDGETLFHVDGTLCVDGSMELMVNRTHRLKMTTVMNEENGIIQVRMWPTIGRSHRNDYFWEIDMLNPVSSINPNAMESETLVTSGSGIVVTPMPGKVSRINFNVGDVVRVGDVVVVLEAMKMEHPCTSTCDGTITEIRVTPNTIVSDNAILFVVTSET